MNAPIVARPRFIAPGSIEELGGFEPYPELAAARRKLELAIALDADGTVSWAGDPVRSIMGVYGLGPDWNIPEIPLASGPARWLATAIYAVDSPNPFLMHDSPALPLLAPLDRALLIARRLAGLAGVDNVRVNRAREAQGLLDKLTNRSPPSRPLATITQHHRPGTPNRKPPS